MKRLAIIITGLLAALAVTAQQRKLQYKPYIDMRPMHFGILIGLNMQDVEMQNVGPHTISLPEGGEQQASVLCDADMWNPGFSVGMLADWRLSGHLSLRIAPTMHFGAKHLVFRNLLDTNDGGRPRESTQDMKNTYIAMPVDLKFAAERFNNYRPYVVAGISTMLNLSGKDQDYVQLKRFDTMVEAGLGCDFYLPFFKLIPELKFCYGLGNALNTGHADELRDANKLAFARSVKSAHTKMFVLTLYFE